MYTCLSNSSEIGPVGGRGRGVGCGHNGNCSYCNYCRRLGYYKDTCYALHGFPLKANVVILENADT